VVRNAKASSWLAWLAVCVLLPATSRAQAPPPDPTRGERADGRIESADTRQWALMVPRVVFFPFRLLVKALEYPTEPMMSFIEKYHVPLWLYEATTTADGLRGVRPELSWNLSFALVPGLSYFDYRSLGRGTSLRVRLMCGGPNIIETGIGVRPTPSAWRTQLQLALTYVRRNDQYFNGIGTVHLGSRYAVDALSFAANGRIRLAQPLSIGFAGESAIKRFGEGDPRSGDPEIGAVYCVRVLGRCVVGTVDPRQVPGFDRGTQFARGTVRITVDSRDRPFASALGLLAGAVVDYTHGLGFDASSYFRISGELGLAIAVWQRSHTFVLRGTTSVIEPTNDVPVPFSELIVLGGPDSLRGFRPGAFRDYSLLLFSGEYRWPIWMYADGSLFVDYGGTFAQNFGDFEAKRLYWDIGAALRITTRSQFLFRVGIAYGFSGGGVQMIISGSGGP